MGGLDHGWIVRFASPRTDFDPALAAGLDHATEHVPDMLGGLTTEHVEELRRLGFFAAVRERIGVEIDVGDWDEIEADALGALVAVVDGITPRASARLRPLLADLRALACAARDEGCSLGFML